MFFKPKLEGMKMEDFARIHEASLHILQKTGIVFHLWEAVDICKKHGLKADGNIIHFSPQVVEQALAACPESFKWQARNDYNSVIVGEGCLVQPNAGPVYIQDMETGRRLATLEDYSNVQKICQAGDAVNLVGGNPVDPHDVDPAKKHLYMMYETLKHTDKPCIGYPGERHQVEQVLNMVETAFGHHNYLQGHHCVGVAVNPLSPLAFAPDALETVIEYASKNQIIFFPPAIMAGVCGPISLLGTIVLQNTEILAGLTFAQLINPGTPVVYTAAATTSNMKRANYNSAAPEKNLIHSVGLTMGRDYYHLPTRSLCGMTEAKTVGCQAGYETMESLMISIMSGASIIVECLGVVDSIMTTSYEKMIIDMELIKRTLRFMKGFDISNEALSIDAIQDIGHTGSYLMHPTTLAQFRDNWMPVVSDWDTYDHWKETGSQDVTNTAHRIYKEILANAPQSLIEQELDRELQNFIIKG